MAEHHEEFRWVSVRLRKSEYEVFRRLVYERNTTRSQLAREAILAALSPARPTPSPPPSRSEP